MRTLRLFLPALLLVLSIVAASPAIAQPAPPGIASADAARLAELLRDDARRAELLRTLEALSALTNAPPGNAAPVAPRPATETERPVAGSVEQAAAALAGARPAPAAAAPAVAAAAAASPAASAEPTPGATRPSAGTTPAAPPPAGVTAAAPPAAAPAAAPAPVPAAPAAPAEAVAEALLVPHTVAAQVLTGVSARVNDVAAALPGTVRAIADLPGLWDSLTALVANPVARTRLLDAAWKLGLSLGAGLVAQWLLGRAVRGLRRRLEAATPEEANALTWLRRLPLLLGRLLLDLLPIAGFWLTTHSVLDVVRPLPTTELIGLMAAQTWILAAASYALADMLLAPGADHLRLLPVSDGVAARGLVWLRRLLLVGVGGYALAEAGRLLGLSWVAYDTVLNIALLAMTLMLLRLVWRQREMVAAALRAPPVTVGEKPDAGRIVMRGLRDRAAGLWHLVAIGWLLALWVIWALDVPDGFRRLITVSALTLAAAVAAKLADEGVRRLLVSTLRPSPEVLRRDPTAAARAASYVPAISGLVSIIVAACGTLLVLQAWGFNALGWFDTGTLGARMLSTLLSIGATFLMAFLVWEAANAAIQRRLARLARDTQAARSARVRTLLPLVRTLLGGLVVIFATLSALAQLGINVAPLLAGAGVIGLAIGFGSQTLVRDVITGIFLLLEDAMAVGDVVKLGGLSGVVEQLTIRSIKLRDLDGSVHIVPFSAVTTVTNMTRDFSFAVLDVLVAYREDTDRIVQVLKEIGDEVGKDPKWAPLIRADIDIWGVEKLADSGVVIRARVKTEPSARWNVGREFNRRIKRRFDELGIEMPYPRQTLVMETPPPVALPRAAE